jgi:hypothetical protein
MRGREVGVEEYGTKQSCEADDRDMNILYGGRNSVQHAIPQTVIWN